MTSIKTLVLILGALSCLGTCTGFSVPCWLCVKVMNSIHEGVLHNSTESAVVDVVEAACIVSRMVSTRVCEASVKEFLPTLMEVIRRTHLDTKAICSELLSDNCGSTFITNWTVPVPVGTPEYIPPQLPKPGSRVIRALHLADPHIDRFYAVGSKVDCSEPLCCRAWLGSGDAGKWGNVKCDAPAALLENLFQHVNTSVDADYVIWTGDIPAHDVWNQTRDDQMDVIVTITKMLQRYMPGAVIYPAVGNHESAPVNVFAPPWETGRFSQQWLYNTLADTWRDWLPEYALDTVRRGGFYSIPHSHDLRIISLNFNFCGSLNFWLYVEDSDPAGQLEWLVQELVKAEAAGEKVHIIGHIPPGVAGCMKTWSGVYNKIIMRFQNTVVAQFFGHTHKDEFQVFFNSSEADADTVPNNVAFIAPSVTTWSNHFPTFRLYDIDGGYAGCSWHVLDHHNYWCNLTDANASGTPKWTLEYSARKSYDMPSLFPRDWLYFAHRCKANDKLLQLYMRHRQHGPASPTCGNAECRDRLICSMLTSASRNTNHCLANY